MTRPALLAMLVMAGVLCGCRAVPAPPGAAQSWEARRAQLQGRDHFQIKGRVAVAAAQEGFTASVRWAQNGTQSQLALDGPLGVGGLRVTTDGTTLVLVNAHGE